MLIYLKVFVEFMDTIPFPSLFMVLIHGVSISKQSDNSQTVTQAAPVSAEYEYVHEAVT